MTGARAAIERRAAAGPRRVVTATIVRGPWPVGIVGLCRPRGSSMTSAGRPSSVRVGDIIRASCRATVARPGATLERSPGCHPPRRTRRGRRLRDLGRALAEFVAAFGERPSRRFPPTPSHARSRSRSAALEIDYTLQRPAQLAPCGKGNEDPCCSSGPHCDARRAATASHAAHAEAPPRRPRRDRVRSPRAAETVQRGDVVDIAARLVSRTFGG
jgi:hypothetical protein